LSQTVSNPEASSGSLILIETITDPLNSGFEEDCMAGCIISGTYVSITTNKNSFEQLNFWYQQVLEHANGLNLPKLLVGSKSDLMHSTALEDLVPEEEIHNFIQEKNLNGFFKTSALENQNVLAVFKELNNLMLKHQNTQYVVC